MISKKQIKLAATKLLEMASNNAAVERQLKNECLCWSDGKTDNLFETLEFLKSKDAKEYQLFASSIVYRVNNPLC